MLGGGQRNDEGPMRRESVVLKSTAGPSPFSLQRQGECLRALLLAVEDYIYPVVGVVVTVSGESE